MTTELAMLSNHLILWHPFCFCLQSFPASGSSPVSQLFASGGQSVGTSASATVLPVNTQDWFPLGLTGLISLHPRDSQDLSLVCTLSMKFFHYSLAFHGVSTSEVRPSRLREPRRPCPRVTQPIKNWPWFTDSERDAHCLVSGGLLTSLLTGRERSLVSPPLASKILLTLVPGFWEAPSLLLLNLFSGFHLQYLMEHI